jgi:phosphonopyruvate decarboxylase
MSMKPEDVLRTIAEFRGNAICVPTMTTAPSWRWIAPDDLSVACVGFMGGASSLGLGLALACPDRPVIVMDGDGSLLMQLGSLATIAGAAPANLYHIVFRNGVYHTSGAQPMPVSEILSFQGLAEASGYAFSERIDNLEDLRVDLPGLLRRPGPGLLELVTGLADDTPMTAGTGDPFSVQVAGLRAKLMSSPL